MRMETGLPSIRDGILKTSIKTNKTNSTTTAMLIILKVLTPLRLNSIIIDPD